MKEPDALCPESEDGKHHWIWIKSSPEGMFPLDMYRCDYCHQESIV